MVTVAKFFSLGTRGWESDEVGVDARRSTILDELFKSSRDSATIFRVRVIYKYNNLM